MNAAKNDKTTTMITNGIFKSILTLAPPSYPKSNFYKPKAIKNTSYVDIIKLRTPSTISK